MNSLSLRKWLGALLLGLGAFALSGWAHADPPSRVARLAYLSGAVSFSPAGENDWVRANVNRPLISGDRLWSDSGARGELQMGAAAIRMGSRTSMTLLNVDDRIAQVQLTQGTLNIRIWRFERNHVFASCDDRTRLKQACTHFLPDRAALGIVARLDLGPHLRADSDQAEDEKGAKSRESRRFVHNAGLMSVAVQNLGPRPVASGGELPCGAACV